ncbi:inosine/xanthosine triphosphatase [Neptunicella sp. SCSIO 80796]|uniref:inosine/xanthosine triphosphatase n=1 Tax=Neptunicella plasticusilytica TaxID=3117012 RepID=UPI003A4D5AFA
MTEKKFKVIVGSQNPVKVNAVKNALDAVFEPSLIECIGINTPSGVADQPLTADETRLGAENRVKYCQAQHRADYYIAIEGGVDQFEYGAATFAYVVISDGQSQSVGRSANLPLPDSIYQALLRGEELGPLIDKLFNTHNIKQKGGAISLFTNGHATRESAYYQALILAMAPFLNPDLYV